MRINKEINEIQFYCRRTFLQRHSHLWLQEVTSYRCHFYVFRSRMKYNWWRNFSKQNMANELIRIYSVPLAQANGHHD